MSEFSDAEIREISDNKPLKIFKYRNFEIPIYFDDFGQQFYCIINGDEFCFGSYNTDYEEDLKYLIDKKLDTLYVFPEESNFYGARLEWFNNGDFRDIRLIFRGRILRIFLVNSQKKLTDKALEKIIEDSLISLAKIITLTSEPK